MVHDNVYVQKAIAGDDKAFDELIKRHRPRIYEVSHRMLGNPREAEGITYASFSEARKHIKAFQGRTAFGTWMYRIAKNQCLQYQQTKVQLGIYS